MLLLPLWCCCPSSVYRDHYVSTKADERETHRDHKRRQASLSDPLITRWFLHQHGFWTPLKHARNMKTEDDRQAHTRKSYTSIQIKSHPRAWSIILDLGNNVCVRIMTTQKVHSVYLCSTSMQIHPFPVNDNFFENSFPNFLTTCFKKKTSYKIQTFLKAASYRTPPLLLHSFFCFARSWLRAAMLFLTSIVWSISHQPTSSFYLLLFSLSFTGKQPECWQ